MGKSLEKEVCKVMKLAIWIFILVVFVVALLARISFMEYKLKAKNLEMSLKMEKGNIPMAPAATPPVDVWTWVLKIGAILSGIKTFWELIDKFRRKK